MAQQGRGKHTGDGLLAQDHVAAPAALPPLVQPRTAMLAEQQALLGAQVKRLADALTPRLIPTPDVQRLVCVPGIGRIVAFTIVLEVDGISRCPSAWDFVSYCWLVPGAGNSGGKTRHKRTKDGTRYLKLAFSHAAVRAIQYFPEIRAFYRATARRKPPALARALVAKELARIVYYSLSKQEAFNGTFKGTPLSGTKTPKWPRAGPLPGEPACLTGAAFLGRRGAPPHWMGAPGAAPSHDLSDRSRDREPAMVCGPHRGDRREARTSAATGTCVSHGRHQGEAVRLQNALALLRRNSLMALGGGAARTSRTRRRLGMGT